jgi:HrpA-like RNA helicase
MDCLVVVPIARAEAWQRSGRAGRQQPGTCYRLYPESVWPQLRPQIVPEVLRANLCTVVLQLKALGVSDVVHFEWMSRPPKEAVVRALVCAVLCCAVLCCGACHACIQLQKHLRQTSPQPSQAPFHS